MLLLLFLVSMIIYNPVRLLDHKKCLRYDCELHTIFNGVYLCKLYTKRIMKGFSIFLNSF